MAAGLKIRRPPGDYEKPDARDVGRFHEEIYRCLSMVGTGTINPGLINAGAIGTGTITVNGAMAGMTVHLGPPTAIEAGLVWQGFVSATNTVTIRIFNTTGGGITPASATWTARCLP